MEHEVLEPKYLKGTSGNLDYIIIRQIGDVVLGIKPVVHFSGAYDENTFIGLRIRSTTDPETPEESNVVDLPVSGKIPGEEFIKAFPNLPFDKVDKTRASMMVGYTVVLHPHTYPGFMKELPSKGWVAALLDYVANHINIDGPMPDSDIVHEWVTDGIVKGLNSLYGEPKTPDPEKTVAAMMSASNIKQVMSKEGLKLIDGGVSDTPLGLPPKF